MPPAFQMPNCAMMNCGTVRQDESDAIAFADAVRRELGRERRAQAIELTEGDDAPLNSSAGCCGPLARSLGDGVDEGRVRVWLKGGWNACVVVLQPGRD